MDGTNGRAISLDITVQGGYGSSVPVGEEEDIRSWTLNGNELVLKRQCGCRVHIPAVLEVGVNFPHDDEPND